jgi:hypothetical protein
MNAPEQRAGERRGWRVYPVKNGFHAEGLNATGASCGATEFDALANLHRASRLGDACEIAIVSRAPGRSVTVTPRGPEDDAWARDAPLVAQPEVTP